MSEHVNGDAVNAPRPLLVKRLDKQAGAPLAEVENTLATEADATLLTCVNWPAFPECPQAAFRIAHVGTEIWLRFDVQEARIRALETKTHGAVYMDSCVEFFVTFDDAAYYNLELNCIGTAHLAHGAGRDKRRFVPLPAMERLAVRASLGTKPFAERTGGFSWSLTARIPLACFAFDTFTDLSGRSARANFYKCGSGLSVQHYVSWRPINTPAPDFHCPEFFGNVRFA